MKTLITAFKRRAVVFLAIGLTLCLVVFLQLTPKKQVHNDSVVLAANTAVIIKPEVVKQKAATVGYPVRLKIPKISVDASLEYVVLNSKGELGSPKSPANAAWFVRGPRPGEAGSAVIDGHYGYENNTPAVFDSLSKLQTGDSISVIDDRGIGIVFVVREIRIFESAEDASGVFASSDGKAHLNLITCQGSWNNSQKSYSNRLVVFTDRS